MEDGFVATADQELSAKVKILPKTVLWDFPIGQNVVRVTNNGESPLAVKIEASHPKIYSVNPTTCQVESKKTGYLVIRRKGGDFAARESLRVTVASVSSEVSDLEKHFDTPGLKIHQELIQMYERKATIVSKTPLAEVKKVESSTDLNANSRPSRPSAPVFDLNDVTVNPKSLEWIGPLGQSVIKVHNGIPRQVALKIEPSSPVYTVTPTLSFLEGNKTEFVVVQRKGGAFSPLDHVKISIARAGISVIDAEEHFKRPGLKINVVNVKMLEKWVHPAGSAAPKARVAIIPEPPVKENVAAGPKAESPPPKETNEAAKPEEK